MFRGGKVFCECFVRVCFCLGYELCVEVLLCIVFVVIY